MFGNDKKLLIPIVYDIANLVRNSARKYMNNDPFDENLPLTAFETPLQKRKFELNADELAAEEQKEKPLKPQPKITATLSVTGTGDSLEDFMVEEEDDSEEFIDPLSINLQLQASMKPMTKKLTATNSSNSVARASVASISFVSSTSSPALERSKRSGYSVTSAASTSSASSVSFASSASLERSKREN